MPMAPTPKLAQPYGRWITKTEAMKTYKLASSDLDSILPVTDDPNPRHYYMRMKTYNVRDVEALAKRLRTNSQASGSTTELATANGPQIMRTTAMNDFGLTSCQMDCLKPVKVLPNPHKSGKTMRFYNRCDVQALADSIAAAAAAPTGLPRRGNATRAAHDVDNDRNVFDGMSNEDAAFALARLTGIVGPAMAYCR